MVSVGATTAGRTGAGSGDSATNQGQEQGQKNTPIIAEPAPPRSLAISARGVKTGEDFANLMSALMSDVLEGRISPDIANASCNAGGKLLKVVEMQYRYGKQTENRAPTFMLAPGSPQG